MNSPMTSNEFGEDVEGRFFFECDLRGIDVIAPEGRPKVYDFLIQRGGKTLKIQVKGTYKLRNRREDAYCRVHLRRNTTAGDHYADAGIDYIAAYVAPWDRWHFVEAKKCTGAHLEMRRNPAGKLKDSINRWDLFK